MLHIKSMEELLKKIKLFIENEFSEKLPKNRTFHSLNHTKNVVKAVRTICQNTEMAHAHKLCLEIAAWFHDYGHVSTYMGHEDISAQKAEEFLKEHNFPEAHISCIKSYIQSTKIDIEPVSLEEKIIRDSDLIHIGQVKYQDHLDCLQKEWKNEFGKSFSEEEWLKENITFLETHSFHTDYAKLMFNEQREKNIDFLKCRLKEINKSLRD